VRVITDNELKEVLEVEAYLESREQYVERMKEDGFQIFVPEKNELQIDIDSHINKELFLQRIERIKEEFDGGVSYISYPSKSEGHEHIIVTLDLDFTNAQRIAMQLVLGSDPIREMLSLFRDFRGDPCSTLLARKEN